MFRIHITSLPRVRSYADALHVVENAKDQDSGWKALNPKRKSDTSKRVRKDGERVIFRFHRTDVVTWHSPNHIEIAYFDSLSTACFIDELTPLSARMHRGELYVEGVAPRSKTVHFYHEHGRWTPDEGDVMLHFEFRVDRKRAAEIRKIINPVIEFRQAYKRMYPNLEPASFGEHVVLALLDNPPKDDVELAKLLPSLPTDDQIIATAFTHKGAVKKIPLPLGTLPKPSKWQAFSHLIV